MKLMTEVVYQPRKKVIIHEYTKYDSVEQLVRTAFASAPPGSNVGPLKWINGIVLVHSNYPHTEAVVKELIEGRLHWNHVSIAPMDEYRSSVHLSDTRITASIIDVSYNDVFQSIGDYIKENLLDKNQE